MRYILFILVLITAGCKNQTKQSDIAYKQPEKQDATPINHTFSKTLKVKDELKIPLDSETTFYCENIQYYINEDEKFLITMPLSSNTIIVYDLSDPKNKQVNKLKIPDEGPNSVGGEISGFYYHNKDSIFILSKFSFKAGLINSEGIIKDTYQILDEYLPYNPVPTPGTFSPMSYINNKLYFSGSTPDKKAGKKYKGSFIEYDIKTRKTTFIDYNPERLNEGYWASRGRLFYDYLIEENNKTTFLLSYSISESIVGFTNQGDVFKKRLPSVHINNNDIFPFSNEFKKADYIERAKYSMAQPRFWGIKINPYQKLIYRFAVEKNSYANFKKSKFPPIHLIVANYDFEILTEKNLYPPTKYQNDMCFVTKEGLYIANKEKYNENDNYLTFDLFVLE